MFKLKPVGRFAQRLYVRIYAALLVSLVVAAALFALAAHRHADPAQSAGNFDTIADIIGEILPPASAPVAEQRAALLHWQPRIHSDLALYGADGTLIGVAGRPLPTPDLSRSGSGYLLAHPTILVFKLPDRRWLLVQHQMPHKAGLGIAALLVLIALAVAVGAFPVVRRLTRRLENLQTSVESWGSGRLATRVAVEGNDEVARLAASFNGAAARIEELVRAQKTLLANASHELRSPLARIRMAAELMPEQGAAGVREELNHNIAELDQLIEELLLASRLDAATEVRQLEEVDLTGLLAEECARVGAQLHAPAVTIEGEPRLLRRMVRNLLENALRHGGGTPVEVSLQQGDGMLLLDVCDNGPGVPEAQRDAIFTPFYRLPGASEAAGGVGLGLSLVRQIARRHHGEVQCLPNEDGGCRFRVQLPRQ